MKRLLRLVFVVLVVVLLPADVAFSEAQKPIRDPDSTCVECNQAPGYVITCGYETDWGEPGWSMCVGGCKWQCMPGGGCECVPQCGIRCYSI
jgi:hypothetical protein